MKESNLKQPLRPDERDTRPAPVPALTAAAIAEAVASIRHGVVQIIIQDGRVVQIDKTEKLRLV